MIYWGARRSSPRGSTVNFALVGKGTQAGQEREFTARIDTDDASARRPGLQMMGLAVDAERLFNNLAPFGVTIDSDLDRQGPHTPPRVALARDTFRSMLQMGDFTFGLPVGGF